MRNVSSSVWYISIKSIKVLGLFMGYLLFCLQTADISRIGLKLSDLDDQYTFSFFAGQQEPIHKQTTSPLRIFPTKILQPFLDRDGHTTL